jgi:hypothetical protein
VCRCWDGSLVTQTDLPPPRVNAAQRPAQHAAATPKEAAPAAPKKEKKAKKPKADDTQAAGTSETKSNTETNQTTPVPRPDGGKRVAAFWIILPGK